MFLQLIRALFPRWNFFDRVGHRLELAYRLQGEDGWHAIPFSHRRTPWNLFFNPTGGMRLAEISLLENFAVDAQENPAGLESLSTYRMIRSLLKFYLNGQGPLQFKVVAEGESGVHEIYISDWTSL
jgi:hypothetical protein